jgi:uracil-DNA glycosylase family 4
MKKSFGNCLKCPLINQKMVIGETSENDDITRSEILILGEAPAKEEVETDRPLVGRSGKIFRNIFKESGLENIPHFITNVCLCSNLDPSGKTSNPPQDAIDCCYQNLEQLIETIHPKLILALGASVAKRLDIEGKMGDLRGKLFSYKNIPVLITYHPSFILKNGGMSDNNKYINSFLNDFNQARKIILGEDKVEFEQVKEPFYFKLPDWCYTDQVKLFDVQVCRKKRSVYLIFIDKDGKRLVHTEPMYKNYFYCTEGTELRNHELIVPIEKLKLLKDFEECPTGHVGYESDIKLEHKYSVDYHFHRNKIGIEELNISPRIQYMDIEVWNENDKNFPTPKLSAKPINAISFYNTGDNYVNVFLLNLEDSIQDKTIDLSKKEFYLDFYEENVYKEIKQIKVTVFKDERKLLKAYCKNVVENNIYIISAYNGINFDFPYIYNRMKVLGLDTGLLSPLGVWTQFTEEKSKKSKKGENKFYNNCFGLYMLDQLQLYKDITIPAEGKKESYALNFIAKLEVGSEKMAYEGNLDSNYSTNIRNFIEYSAVDTKLLFEIDEKRKHIDMYTELVKVCSTTWKSTETTKGLVEPIFLQFLKKRNYSARDHYFNNNNETFKGAFVNKVSGGIKTMVIDLDYTSLYPSVIYTFNIDPTTYYARIDENIAKSYLFDKNNLPDEFIIELDPWKHDIKSFNITKDQFIKLIKEKQLIVTIAGTIFYGHDVKKSFIGELCSEVLSTRKFYKKEMFKYADDPLMHNICNNRQLAYKILANSIYGVLASKYFRLFNLDLAKTITLTGQEVNKFAQFHASKYLETKNTNIDLQFLNKIEDEGNPKHIIYGDTDSLFLTFGEYLIKNKYIDINDPNRKEKSVEITLQLAKELSESLNKKYLTQLVNNHNIKEENSKLELKQELVADRTLFFNVKKRYAMHIVNQEGHARDEYCFRGITLRRSDYPSYTKECLGKILDLILLEKEISISKILDYIKKVEQDMYNLALDGDKSIARPVSFNKNLEEYDQTKIVNHIQSMVNWNILEYETFVSGTRGYQFKITGIDTSKAPEKVISKLHLLPSKFNSISIPVDVDKLPNYYIIDLEATIEFAWKNRYNEILEPLMDNIKQYETIKSMRR